MQWWRRVVGVAVLCVLSLLAVQVRRVAQLQSPAAGQVVRPVPQEQELPLSGQDLPLSGPVTMPLRGATKAAQPKKKEDFVSDAALAETLIAEVGAATDWGAHALGGKKWTTAYEDKYGTRLVDAKLKAGSGIGDTAYCVYGKVKGVADVPGIVRDLEDNVLKVLNADLFVVTAPLDVAAAAAYFAVAVSVWGYATDFLSMNPTAWFLDRNPQYVAQAKKTVLNSAVGHNEFNNVFGCLTDETGKRWENGHTHCQLLDMLLCHEVVERHEKLFGNGKQYKYVAYGRSDLRYLNRHVDIPTLDEINTVGCWVTTWGRDAGGIMDHYGICRRSGSVAATAYGRGSVDIMLSDPAAVRKVGITPVYPNVWNAEGMLLTRLQANKVTVGRLPLFTSFRSYLKRQGRKGHLGQYAYTNQPPPWTSANVSGYCIRFPEWKHMGDFQHEHQGRLWYTEEELLRERGKWLDLQRQQFLPNPVQPV